MFNYFCFLVGFGMEVCIFYQKDICESVSFQSHFTLLRPQIINEIQIVFIYRVKCIIIIIIIMASSFSKCCFEQKNVLEERLSVATRVYSSEGKHSAKKTHHSLIGKRLLFLLLTLEYVSGKQGGTEEERERGERRDEKVRIAAF